MKNHLLISSTCLLMMTACGPAEIESVTQAGYRCDVDGLCIPVHNDRQLAVGYRAEGHEFSFDALYRKNSLVGKLKGAEPWCRRVLYDNERTCYSDYDARCPDAWKVPLTNGTDPLGPEEQRTFDRVARKSLRGLRQNPPTAGHEGSWEALAFIMESVITESSRQVHGEIDP